MNVISLLLGISPAPEEVEVDIATPFPPFPTGKITLEHSLTQIGDLLYEGSVFIDGRPIGMFNIQTP